MSRDFRPSASRITALLWKIMARLSGVKEEGGVVLGAHSFHGIRLTADITKAMTVEVAAVGSVWW